MTQSEPSADAPLTGRTIVVTGTDPSAAGAIARELEGRGARVLVFVGDTTDEAERTALVDMLTELDP